MRWQSLPGPCTETGRGILNGNVEVDRYGRVPAVLDCRAELQAQYRVAHRRRLLQRSRMDYDGVAGTPRFRDGHAEPETPRIPFFADNLFERIKAALERGASLQSCAWASRVCIRIAKRCYRQHNADQQRHAAPAFLRVPL
jgi:hypothetical protein